MPLNGAAGMTGPGNLLCRRNSKLESFLKRNTDRAVYDRIRAYEPCVVVSESVNKVYMHVVLTDECVYLTQYPPRTLTAAVSLSRVREISLINDLPDFLTGKERERSQHIRIVYAATKPTGRGDDWQWRSKKEGRPPSPQPSQRAHLLTVPPALDGKLIDMTASQKQSYQRSQNPAKSLNQREVEGEDIHMIRPVRSASCPNPETLGLPRFPRPPAQPPSPSPSFHSSVSPLVSRRRASVLARLLRRERVRSGERDAEEREREAELHLYAVSRTSRIYLHLQSSWNSYIIRSTLLLDPLYRRRCSALSSSSPHRPPSAISWERTAHLFCQLSAELLQEGISLESLYVLLQELRTAAHRNTTLRKLFWRSSEMAVFLVQTLENSLQNPKGVYTADQLLLSTVIVQTLAIMFREMEVEPGRLSLLTAKKGALTARMLLALVCDPEIQTRSPGSPTDPELQALLAEYLDAANSLLFELLLLGQEASRCSSAENFLTVGWILRVLQPHPHLLSFMDHQAQQVVLVLSDVQRSALTPMQSVLLFQRCRLLLACLQYSQQLSQHLRSLYSEEFRYYVRLPCAEEKLPSHYPISQPALRLLRQLLALILHR
uniref:Si:ch211-258f14.2 n=1 Tax=Myripristis murdjan TaxID=586833 RepID=A0A667ZSS5_9TELE